MTWAARIKVVCLTFLPFLLTSLLLYLLTWADLVEKDPLPFDGRALEMVYQSGDGSLVVRKAKNQPGYVIEGPINAHILVNREGRVTVAGGGMAYTPFWLPFKNPVLRLDTRNPEFLIADTAGILGSADKTYQARQEGSFILWDENLQSQASYNYGLFDGAGNRAASAVYDATCGLLFRLQIKQPDKPDLRLLSTDFPISRNRVFLVWTNLALAGLLAYWLFRRAGRQTEPTFAAHEARLIMLGMICLATDTLMDLWYPYAFGRVVPIVWHMFLIIAIFRFSPLAVLPAVAELVMTAGIWMYYQHTAPAFAFIPGLTVSFLLAIRGRRREWNAQTEAPSAS